MKNRILNSLLTVQLILFAALLGSCQEENGSAAGGERTLEIGVDMPQSALTYGPTETGTADENNVFFLRTMIFDSNTGVHESGIKVAGPVPFPYARTYIVKVGTSKKIVVIGNEQNAPNPILDAVQNYSELQALEIENLTTLNARPDNLPFCSIKEISINAGSDKEYLQIGLKRSISKVRVRVAKGENINRDVYLKEVQIRNAAPKSSLMEEDRKTWTIAQLEHLPAQVYNPQEELKEAAVNIITVPTKYIYEYIPATMDEGTFVRATFNAPVLGVDDIREFDIPMVYAYNGKIPKYGVARNVLVDMLITFYGDKIRITYNVMPWEDVANWDKDPQLGDESYAFTDWVDVVTYGAEPGGNVGNTNPSGMDPQDWNDSSGSWNWEIGD